MGSMSREWATKIRNIGNNLPKINELYHSNSIEDVSQKVNIIRDIAYGTHERQILDLYLPSILNINQLPVVVFFHGGGFIRGDKRHRENIGHFLAVHGFATVLVNYRLAPESSWPSGAEDAAFIWQWVQKNVDLYRFNKNKIFLMGESAGAAHVASIALIKKFQPPEWNILGAILLSGPYNPQLEHLAARQLSIQKPDIRNESYFGADIQQWEAASIVDLIDVEPFPILISYTELDLPQMQVQASELFAKLVCQHGFDPELLIVPDHNHFSQGYSFGLTDTSISQPILNFLKQDTLKVT